MLSNVSDRPSSKLIAQSAIGHLELLGVPALRVDLTGSAVPMERILSWKELAAAGDACHFPACRREPNLLHHAQRPYAGA